MPADDLTEDDGVASLVGARPATTVEPTDLDDPADPTEVTRREGAERGPRPARDAKLARGANIGRYVVLDVLGQGGMGVVYSAYDPELDRKVAIKLLQAKPAAGSSSSGDQAWLYREAQALARLSHPNVIAVHDVGTLPGERVFVAIELVDGQTLRAWLAAKPRDWREVRRVMLEAGAGLSAAHAAGLVHRDFKPENVLVGHDGRVRVMDFGLARAIVHADIAAARTSDLTIEARSPLSETLTLAGTTVGTPAYMAPEIYDGQGASERSDQFAFGVTLYEALFRQRPYDRKALIPPRELNLAPKPPPASRVPPRLARIALRAVALEPDARYPSLGALLDELAVDPTAAKRRTLYAASALAVTGAIVAGSIELGASSAEPPRLCKDAERHLTGVWDASAKASIQQAFARSSRPFKDRAYTGVVATLDRYASEWTAAVTASCEATRLRGEQTDEVHALRQDCFDRRLEELGAFAKLLGEADDALVDKALTAADSLEPVKRCANVAALMAPERPTAEIKPQLERPQRRLADAKAGLIAGNFGRAINASEEAAELAAKIPFDPVVAEAKLVLGMALINVGNGPDALVALEAATWAGLRGKRDDIAAVAALHASLASTENLNNNAEGRIWLALGTAIGKRLGGELDRRFEQTRLELAGVVAAQRGDLIGATKAHEDALALAIQLHGRDAAVVARDEQLLGATLSRAGDYAKARGHYERALELMLKVLGPDHPDIALLESGLGSCYHYTGDSRRAYAAFQRALEIRERVFGANSPVLIPTLNNFAELMRDDHDAARGLPLIERAKAITEETVGRSHAYYVVTTATMGEILIAAGRVDEARKVLDDSVLVAERTKSPYLAAALTARARVARLDHKWTAAAALDARAIELYEASAGKDAPEMWKPLVGLAESKVALAHPAEARPLLERAIAIAEKTKLPPAVIAPARALLASLR